MHHHPCFLCAKTKSSSCTWFSMQYSIPDLNLRLSRRSHTSTPERRRPQHILQSLVHSFLIASCVASMYSHCVAHVCSTERRSRFSPPSTPQQTSNPPTIERSRAEFTYRSRRDCRHARSSPLISRGKIDLNFVVVNIVFSLHHIAAYRLSRASG